MTILRVFTTFIMLFHSSAFSTPSCSFNSRYDLDPAVPQCEEIQVIELPGEQLKGLANIEAFLGCERNENNFYCLCECNSYLQLPPRREDYLTRVMNL